jgi:hypothetical protein
MQASQKNENRPRRAPWIHILLWLTASRRWNGCGYEHASFQIRTVGRLTIDADRQRTKRTVAGEGVPSSHYSEAEIEADRLPFLMFGKYAVWSKTLLPSLPGLQWRSRLRVHSVRRAHIGSVRVARQAGKKQAADAAIVITAHADPKAKGSRGLT